MTPEKLDYLVITPHDRLGIAREALRVRELEHFRLYVGTPSAAPMTPEARAQQVDEIKKLQEIVKGLEDEASKAAPPSPQPFIA